MIILPYEQGSQSAKALAKALGCKVLKDTGKEVRYKMNINTLHKIEEEKVFEKNDIGRIMLRTALPLFYDSYRKNRTTGSFILVEEGTNITVGAGMII
jgi:sulfate adenylyltransferase subunit 1